MMQSAVLPALVVLGLMAAAQARPRIEVIDGFGAGGNMPYAGITLWHGSVFGTTDSGGTGQCLAGLGCGTVFSVSRAPGGKVWTPATLYNFQGGADGAYPAAPVAVDRDGDVYGYTATYSKGVVFRLVPGQSGYSFDILYTFKGGADGNLTYVGSPPIVRGGRVYGVASGGSGCGQVGCGSVFRLDPPGQGGGTWTKRVLYSFTGKADGGAVNWVAGFDAAGGLYVATGAGNGAVSRVAPMPGGGGWASQVIARFGGRAGSNPTNLVLAPDGVVYGTAAARRGGTVFSLTPTQPGGWTEATVYDVNVHGYAPSSLALGPAGSVIGVIYGDQDLYFGEAFRLTPPGQGGGRWGYSVLWNFNRGPDQNPANILAEGDGRYFGVLTGGGYSNGSVFLLRGE